MTNIKTYITDDHGNFSGNYDDDLAHGISLEKKGDWKGAHEYWCALTNIFPSDMEILFHIIHTALKTDKLNIALETIELIESSFTDKMQFAALEGKAAQAKRMAMSASRVNGMNAFKENDYETARLNFKILDKLDPEHPWANAYLRLTSGLAYKFGIRLKAQLPLVRQRIYLTGCGRSGTWLMAAMLKGIDNLTMAPGERPLGEFLWMKNEPAIHLVKRQHNAYQYFSNIPHDIKIIHVVRHPLDVLMSQHLNAKNYIGLERLEGEHRAFFDQLIDRKNTIVIRFEDVVTTPEIIQNQVENFIEEKASYPFKDFYKKTSLPGEIVQSMNGLRPLDPTALHRWRNDPVSIEYLTGLLKNSDGTTMRFCEHFDYELRPVEMSDYGL